MVSTKFTEVSPLDEYNRRLVSNVRPTEWVNPEPAPRYHLVVVGAGTAGLIAASFIAGAGGRVALVEQHLMGGDCLNSGCVPSKCLIRSSRLFAEFRDATELGWRVPGDVRPDFPAVMARMRRLRAKISLNDSVWNYSEQKGIDVFFGSGHFTGSDKLEVDGKILRFKKAIIATGARPTIPQIPGLSDVGFLTNETVFNLTDRPRRLAVIGAGPNGSELAQAFCRLGSEVTLVDMANQILTREDRDVASIVEKSMIRDGVNLMLNCEVQRVEQSSEGKVLSFMCDEQRSIVVDEIFVGVGRVPNLERLNLEVAGVNYDQTGIRVNDNLRTSNPRIYGAGDICMDAKFTHVAEDTARIAAQNAFFPRRCKISALTIPWCTYTDPEIAHVGMYENEAKKRGIEIDTFIHHWKDVDRAIIDGEEEGIVKIHVKKRTDQILGGTIVSRHASEMVGELTLAIVGKLGLGTLSKVIHPYPTRTDSLRRAAFSYSLGRVTPTIKKLLRFCIEWLR